MANSAIPAIFKYIKLRWGSNLLNEGSLRICPLKYYTDVENLGQAIGDRLEGQRTSSMEIKNYGSGENSYPNKRAFLRELGFSGDQVATIYMSDITYEVSNYYVFCVSSVLSYGLGKEFCGEDDTSIITIPASSNKIYGAETDATAEHAHPAGYGTNSMSMVSMIIANSAQSTQLMSNKRITPIRVSSGCFGLQ